VTTGPVRISVSVVSHRQGGLVRNLLADLHERCTTEIEVLLTVNIPEVLPFAAGSFRFPVHVVENDAPKGFGANHNAAFLRSSHDVFCVVNPDIRLPTDPFPDLLERLADAKTGVVAPLAQSTEGKVEDSARAFPTPFFILRKALLGPPPPRYRAGDADLTPDWVGGMFMLIPRDAFGMVNGFDERYHLYYEDVDLCARLRLAGKEIVFCPSVEVLHDAQRQSRHSLRYLGWHLASMLRFFTSTPFVRLVIGGSRRSLPDHRGS
jgi:GT2 family glycosyltransferase